LGSRAQAINQQLPTTNFSRCARSGAVAPPKTESKDAHACSVSRDPKTGCVARPLPDSPKIADKPKKLPYIDGVNPEWLLSGEVLKFKKLKK